MFRFFSLLTLAICVVSVLSIVSEHTAEAAVPNRWTGQFDGIRWNRDGNWDGPVPNATHDVIFDIATPFPGTLMDIPSQWFNNNPRDIATYTMDAAGFMRLGAYAGQQDSTMINVFGDVVAGASYQIGIGPLDAFVVGNPLPARWIQDPPIPPVLTSKVVGVDFDMIGDSANLSILAVTNFIGPGTLTAENAAILVGFEANPFDLLGRVPIDYTQGHISNNGAPPGNEPAWTLNGGVTLFAKKCDQLGHWQTNGVQGRNVVQVDFFFEVNTMEWRSRDTDFDQDFFEVGNYPDGLAPPIPDGGLHIINSLSFLTMDLPPGEDDQECGAEVWVEKFTARAGAVLTMDGGTRFSIATKGPPGQGAGPADDAHFSNGSVLKYGSNTPGDFCFEQLFQVSQLGTNSGNPEGVPMKFLANSYITSMDDPNDPNYDNELDFYMDRTSLEIQSRVSHTQNDLYRWHTADVDLKMSVWAGFDKTLEVIAEDQCNIWFDDSHEGGNVLFEPRCLKSWRSFEATYVGSGQATDVTLVDQFDNHRCGQPATPPDGAMYVIGDLTVSGTPKHPCVVVGSHRLYYGGALSAGEDFFGNQPTQLVITQYGDFNGNCLVDDDDCAKISAYVTQFTRCTWPLADLDGDCIVGMVELTEVMTRARTGGNPRQSCDPNQPPFPDLACLNASPGLNGGGGSPQSFGVEISPEDSARFSDAFVGYMSTRDPRTREALVMLSGVFDNLAKAGTQYLSAAQCQTVARALEDPGVEYVSEEVKALVPAIARRLRQ